jgi:DegV family protein with EDD domain
MGDYMTIRIVTDSACDLPENLIQEYNIGVIPLFIHIGEQSYLDGIEMKHDRFYENLEKFPNQPKTAAPGPEVFSSFYRQAVTKAGDQVFAIHVAGSLSAVYRSALIGAQSAGVPVTVMDSKQVALGAGLQVLAAAKAAAGGATIQEIRAIVGELGQRIHLFAVLDTMKFLQRSGRINLTMLGIGSLLHIKPILKVHEGLVITEKITTHVRAMTRLIHLAKNLGTIEHISMIHTQALDAAKKLYEQVSHLVPESNKPIFQTVTPVVGAHVGPKAVGLVCVTH